MAERTWEMQGRCRGDAGEMQGRYSGADFAERTWLVRDRARVRARVRARARVRERARVRDRDRVRVRVRGARCQACPAWRAGMSTRPG